MNNSRTYFFPTRHTHFCDHLTKFPRRLNAIELYDLATFVDDFILYDSVYLNQDFLNILTDIFVEHGVEDIGDILLPIEGSFLEGYPRKTEDLAYNIDKQLKGYDQQIQKLISKRNKNMKLKELRKKNWTYLKKITPLCEEVIKNLKEEIKIMEEEIKDLKLYNVIKNIGHGIFLKFGDDILRDMSSYDVKHAISRYQEAFDLQLYAVRFRSSLSPGIGYTSMFQVSPNKNKLYDLYKIVSQQLKADIEQLSNFFNMKYIYLPPFLSILLSRCNSTEDIPTELRKLREEFIDIRKTNSRYQQQITNAKSFGEVIDISREYQVAQETLTKAISNRKKSKYIRNLWDIVKSASIKGMLTKTLDLVLDWDTERQNLTSVKSFYDIYGLVRDIKKYDRLMLKCFGKSGIDYRSFDELEKMGIAFTRRIIG